MTASIFGDRFAAFREPAWHGLGTVFQERMSATDAALLAKLDYQIEQVGPLYVPKPVWINGAMQLDKTALVKVEGKALFRQPVPDDDVLRYLGTVSDGYEILQNMDIAKVLDPITSEFPVETAGALHAGETVFFALDAGTEQIISGDEEVRKYFVVTDRRDGGHALRCLFTAVRVVCQNTLSAAMSEASVNIAIHHRKGVKEELDFQIRTLGDMKRAMDKTMAIFRAMAERQAAVEEVEQILKAAYPEPTKPRKVAMREGLELDITALKAQADGGDRVAELFLQSTRQYELARDRQDQYRVGAMELFERMNDEHPKVANTVWAAYNAVVETEDYRRGTTNQPGESVLESIVFGDRAKTKVKAYRASVALL
jgi:phage/plasmid-like protein (TIGR03299 family)